MLGSAESHDQQVLQLLAPLSGVRFAACFENQGLRSLHSLNPWLISEHPSGVRTQLCRAARIKSPLLPLQDSEMDLRNRVHISAGGGKSICSCGCDVLEHERLVVERFVVETKIEVSVELP